MRDKLCRKIRIIIIKKEEEYKTENNIVTIIITCIRREKVKAKQVKKNQGLTKLEVKKILQRTKKENHNNHAKAGRPPQL